MAPKVGGTPEKQLELPILIFGPLEVRRLARELEALEEYIEQSEIREPGKQPALPKTSRLLDALAANNNLNLLVDESRTTLKDFLAEVDTKAPVIHVSFATDPASAFTAKIVAWLRTNIHPYALLHLGLQPSIAAGCIVRTSNKSFDFSLRNRFFEQRELLVKEVSGVGKL
jgi:F0F1-type ATP synthase delta subunit